MLFSTEYLSNDFLVEKSGSSVIFITLEGKLELQPLYTGTSFVALKSFVI